MTESVDDFEAEASKWLAEHAEPATADPAEGELVWGDGEFSVAVFHSLSFEDERDLLEEAKRWNQLKATRGYHAITGNPDFGGMGLSKEHARAFAALERNYKLPSRHESFSVTTGLIAPTVELYGTDEQKVRFVAPFLAAEMLCCQLFSEPGAGSDLATLGCRAVRDGDEWVINGQKVWSSGAQFSQWGELIARTDPDVIKHKGLTAFMLPLDAPGVEVRPIKQMSGGSSFCEVFFSDARTAKNNIVGAAGGGWAVAMGTLAFERGASTLGQQMLFQNELDEIIRIAKQNGKGEDPLVRQRIAQAWMGLRIQRYHALRTLVGGGEEADPPPAAMISKLFWATWHRDLGKLAMDVMGPEAELAEGEPYDLTGLQRMFLFTRSDTIYAGSNEIQRNILSERVLGLPREPR